MGPEVKVVNKMFAAGGAQLWLSNFQQSLWKRKTFQGEKLVSLNPVRRKGKPLMALKLERNFTQSFVLMCDAVKKNPQQHSLSEHRAYSYNNPQYISQYEHYHKD